MTARVAIRSESVSATSDQEASGFTSLSTIGPESSIPAAFSRFFNAPPKKPAGSSTAIGVDHQAPRMGTVPDTVTALEPAARPTATRTLPRLPTVRAEESARSVPDAGSIEIAAGRPGRAPGRISTRTTPSL